jgi:ubiquinone/menaquinone biosynthesis C-methylase UbiE
LQQNLLKDAFGGLIQAPIEVHASSEILDVGTGAGVWLLDLDQTAPVGATLHGIDIEPRLFPDTTSTKTGVTFSVGSALALPVSWNNRFDLVHQRLLVAAWRDIEWPQAIAAMLRVLKPGGSIELGGKRLVRILHHSSS